MYARSTTFHGRPDNIDAGIAFVKNEAGPMLDTIEGCRGLSMLVDRATGHCIATSSWETEEAMRASDEQLRPIRDRGRDILGGSMQVDEWEIAVMHRTHHGDLPLVQLHGAAKDVPPSIADRAKRPIAGAHGRLVLPRTCCDALTGLAVDQHR